jgi:predicted TIM-barrel fold metal-dependent hydrolase
MVLPPIVVGLVRRLDRRFLGAFFRKEQLSFFEKKEQKTLIHWLPCARPCSGGKQMPGFIVPPGATDCHMHVFGDMATYKPAALRAYDPRPAGLADYRRVFAPLGFSRVVLVQPSAYGTDNRCMLDALRADDAAATRAVAVIDATTTDAALDEMASLRVRGIRLNLVSNGIPDPAAAIAALREAAARVGPRGWHVQIFCLPSLFAALAPVIPTLGVAVVVDHMGGADARSGERQPGLDELVELVAAGQCWVKVSGPNRVSRETNGFRDAVPISRRLIAANPARIVWGSDWPHIGPHKVGAPEPVVYMKHDNTDLVRILGEATVGDARLLQQILVDNPAGLYGFGS